MKKTRDVSFLFALSFFLTCTMSLCLLRDDLSAATRGAALQKNAPQQPLACQAPFSDISGHWAETYIDAVYCEGITTGYGDNTFRPSETVDRAQMAVFIIRAFYGEAFAYSSTPYFKDVPASHWAFRYIQKMKELGITTGCTSTTYCPAEMVSRQEMAVFLARAKFGDVFAFPSTPYFTDVPKSHQFFRHIQKIREANITEGCTIKKFCPDNVVTRCEMAAFLNRTFLITEPVAIIELLSPNPSPFKQEVVFSGHGADRGTVQAYNWRSSISGHLSTSKSFTTSDLPSGLHTIYFKVKDNDGNWSRETSKQIDIQEHIYIGLSYTYFSYAKSDLERMFQSMGATKTGDVWQYRNSNTKIMHILHFVQNNDALRQALQTEGSHVIINGHSNFGLGAVFATEQEQRSLTINDIKYVDDDRIFNYSTPTAAVHLDYFRVNQAWPFWWPEYKDGSSALAPYKFGDPKGAPAYNYYLTYQVPGDPVRYKIDSIQRFPDSGKPAWFSSSGDSPDAENPNHKQYFITSSAAWSPQTQKTGDWTESKGTGNYWKENYHYSTPGTGSDTFSWSFDIAKSGIHKVSAWWTSSPLRASNAPYTITHSGGDTTVRVNQQQHSGSWNSLGNYHFAAGHYTVRLNDNADGNVVADAIRIADVDNPPEILQANFVGEHRIGPAPLVVNLKDQSTGDLTSRRWELGDGYIATDFFRTSNFYYIYKNPGTYTITLTVGGRLGTSTTTREGYVIVTDAVSTPPSADFEIQPTRTGNIPFTVNFANRSLGELVSYRWDFGDGSTSTAVKPSHTYTAPGVYSVSLTVTDSSGKKVKETKEDYIRAVAYENTIDNMSYPKVHYGYKIIVARKGEMSIRKEDLKFERLLYDACTSGPYYLETLGRGTAFYTTTTENGDGMFVYLKAYLEGKSDEQIWELLQDFNPIFSYYNFNRYPSEQ